MTELPPDDGAFAEELGEFLVEQGRLSRPALARALHVRAESSEAFCAILTSLGFVAEADLAEALAERLHLPLVDVAALPEQPLLAERISLKFL